MSAASTDLLAAAVDVLDEVGFGSTSVLTRRLRINHGTAAYLLDELQRRGVVDAGNGTVRNVLLNRDRAIAALNNHPQEK